MSRDAKYEEESKELFSRIIDALATFQKRLTFRELADSVLDAVIPRLYDRDLNHEERESVRKYIEEHREIILHHIIGQEFFEITARLLCREGTGLSSRSHLPDEILKPVNEKLTTFGRAWETDLETFKAYLQKNKELLLRRIEELNARPIVRSTSPERDIITAMNAASLAPSTCTDPPPTPKPLPPRIEPPLPKFYQTQHKPLPLRPSPPKSSRTSPQPIPVPRRGWRERNPSTSSLSPDPLQGLWCGYCSSRYHDGHRCENFPKDAQ